MERSETSRSRKKRKTTAKPEIKSISIQRTSYDEQFNIAGIIKIALSTETQRYIGCVLGEDLTVESPWTYILKDKFQDHIYLHEKDSEFLPIRKIIKIYPEDEMLIGFHKALKDGKLQYYICSNLSSKTTVSNILQKESEELQRRMDNSIWKYPRHWKSLGSEEDVNLDIIKNIRPLIEIELDSAYPFYSQKIKFKLRLVEQAKDGYVEILPGRYPITNVYRKIVDCGTQVSPTLVHREVQTIAPFYSNVWTQYNYEYNEPILNRVSQKNLVKFVTEQADRLRDTINVNEHINLYTDDYMKMAKTVIQFPITVPRDIVSFREVIACKGKLVSDVGLNPFISGMLAASYTRAPFNKFYDSPDINDEVNETVFGKHLVLIWGNTSSTMPKLYLYSYREVNVVKFCAFRPNILIGGCTNGQIVLWDLTGKLEEMEYIEVLSQSELNHRLIMYSLTSWMKNTYNNKVVYPTAVSSFNDSHIDTVTGISWILPDYEFTNNGKLERCEEGKESMQIMTCGLGGRVLIWNFLSTPIKNKPPKPIDIEEPEKLSERPETLNTNVSEFRHLHNRLIPQYKLLLKNTITSKFYPITNMVLRNKKFKFKALIPDTENNPFKRTYFEPVMSTTDFQYNLDLKITDRLGHFMYCTFEGHDFDQGQQVNRENLKYVQSTFMHDGPIRHCLTSPFHENIVLTIGGQLFAIWDTSEIKHPLFWRKSHKKYFSGFWSDTIAGTLVVLRSDSYFETWDILNRTKTPGRLVRMSGNSMTDTYIEPTMKHSSKLTYATADCVGAVKIFESPKSSPLDEAAPRKAYLFYERILKIRKQRELWLINWKMKHGFNKLVEPEGMPPRESGQQEKSDKGTGNKGEGIKEEKNREKKKAEEEEEKRTHKKTTAMDSLTGSNKWHVKQEKLMYEILIQRAHLNIPEIERNKIPLRKLIAEKLHWEKIKDVLQNKENIFEKAKNKVFQETVFKRKKFVVTFPDKIVATLKECYIEQFQGAIDHTLEYVAKNPFTTTYNREAMISCAKDRRREMINCPSKFNRVHKQSEQNLTYRRGTDRTLHVSFLEN